VIPLPDKTTPRRLIQENSEVALLSTESESVTEHLDASRASRILNQNLRQFININEEIILSIYRDYIQPQTIKQAIEILANDSDSTAVVAGGTDLLLDMQQGRHPDVDLMVDVSAVDEMTGIELVGNSIYVGAATTHKQIITSPLLQQHAQCMVEGCGLIGGPQVRNVATIGGNVAHALPAGDGTISLLALNAEVQIASADGLRWEPLIDIFAGPGRVTFDRRKEIVTAFRFQEGGIREASAFRRIMRPQGVAIAILNMAAWVKLDGDGRLADVRISCGPAGPRPFRARGTEAILKGKILDDETFESACQTLDSEVSLRTSAHRATKEYRHTILPVLLRKVLYTAIARSN
jgi:carbon-monoxide dehydrogenase medium subunit